MADRSIYDVAAGATADKLRQVSAYQTDADLAAADWFRSAVDAVVRETMERIKVRVFDRTDGAWWFDDLANELRDELIGGNPWLTN